MKTQRNDPCPCGSGKKYKKCCEAGETSSPSVSAHGMPPVNLLQQAIAHHQAGRLNEAEEIYRSILRKDGRQPDALHLLGMIMYQRGDLAQAETLIKKAIALDAKAPFFHLNLGNVLKDLDRTDEAISSFRTALAHQPQLAEAHFNLGNAYCKQNEPQRALPHYNAAIRIKPDLAEAHGNRGKAMAMLTRFDEAIESYSRALNVRPDFFDAWYGLGTICQTTGRYQDAVDHFAHALKLQPDHAYTHYNMGNALKDLERYGEAERFYRKAIRARAAFGDAYNNLSVVLRCQGRTLESLDAVARALELDQNNYAAYNNLGMTLREGGDALRSVEGCERAIALNPEYGEAHLNLALALLQLGDFRSGWRQYEWRFQKRGSPPRPVPFPRWNGSPIPGKSLLIYAEQGVGDHIMFSSLFEQVVPLAARCTVECDSRLIPLFSRSFQGLTFMPMIKDLTSDALPPVDAAVPMGSLPLYLRPDLESFPERSSYLKADGEKTAIWRERYDALGKGLKIGISWRGGKEASVRNLRSTSLPQWSGLFSIPGVTYINLQYGECSGELAAVREQQGITVHDWPDADPLQDLDGFASKIAALDLVISVDNSTVHLAGALGTPTWVLLPKASDWRWMEGCDDTPWYGSVRLFRQASHGGWADLFAVVSAALEQRLAFPRQEANRGPSSYRSSGLFHAPSRTVVAFLNDTTYWYHWGCTGTSTAIHDAIASRGYAITRVPITTIHVCKETPATAELFDDPAVFRRFSEANAGIVRELGLADIIVVNGEGTLHGDHPTVITLLYLIYAAKVHLGKAVQIINHSCYPENSLGGTNTAVWQLYKKVYGIADFIAIREPVSHALLEREGIRAELSFDCLPLYIAKRYQASGQRSRNTIVISGSVVVREEGLAEISSYVRAMAEKGYAVQLLTGANMLPAADDEDLVRRLTTACPGLWTHVNAGSMNEWLDTIGNASLFVSGRFHHTIAAAVLGTPVVLLNSNTPKNTGLARVLRIDPPLSYGNDGLLPALLKRTDDVMRMELPERERTRTDLHEQLCRQAEKNFLRL